MKTKTPATPEMCGTCKFFKPRLGDPSANGNCHRYPPVIDGLQVMQWQINGHDHGEAYASDSTVFWGVPCVNSEDWCGEWKEA